MVFFGPGQNLPYRYFYKNIIKLGKQSRILVAISSNFMSLGCDKDYSVKTKRYKVRINFRMRLTLRGNKFCKQTLQMFETL